MVITILYYIQGFSLVGYFRFSAHSAESFYDLEYFENSQIEMIYIWLNWISWYVSTSLVINIVRDYNIVYNSKRKINLLFAELFCTHQIKDDGI